MLISFLRCPTSSVKSYVRGIVIQQTGEVEEPWAHKVYSKLHYVENLQKVYHKIMADTPSSTPMCPSYALRSVHQGLPRSLPSLYYRCTTLQLSDVRLVDFTDLVTLVGEMNCENVELMNVSWHTCPANPPPILRKTKRVLHARIRAYSCKDVEPWKFFWLCITTKEPRTPDIGQYVPFIDAQEFAPVENLLRWAMSGSLATESAEAQTDRKVCNSTEISGTSCAVPKSHSILDSSMSFSASFGYREFILKVRCQDEKPCSPDYEIYFSSGIVVRIRVLYSEGSQEQPIAEYKWEEFDSLTEPFLNLQRVIITAHTTSSDPHKHEKGISERMERLDRDKKLMFRTMDRVVANPRWS